MSRHSHATLLLPVSGAVSPRTPPGNCPRAAAPFERLPLELLTQVVQWVAYTPRELLALQGVSRKVREACRQDVLWQTWCPQNVGVQGDPWPQASSMAPPAPPPGGRLVDAYLFSAMHVAVRTSAETRLVPFGRKRRMLRALYRLDALASGREPATTPGAAQLVRYCAEGSAYLSTWLRHSDGPRAPRLLERPQRLDLRAVGELFRGAWAEQFRCDEVRDLLATVGGRGVLRVGGPGWQGAWALYGDFDVVRAMLPLDPHVSCALEGPLRAQRGLMLQAVRASGLAWPQAAPELRTDDALFVAALRQTPWALQFGDATRRAHRATCLSAVARNPATLSLVEAALRDDNAFMGACLDVDGMVLEFASARLRAERPTVLRAVRQNGRALQFAAPALQADEALVEVAARQHGEALTYVVPSLARSRRLLLLALAGAPSLLDALQRRLPTPEGAGPTGDHARAAVHRGTAAAFVDDDEVVLAAVRADGHLLRLADPRLQGAPNVVAAAVRRAPEARIYAREPAASSVAIARLGVVREPRTFGILPRALQQHPRVLSAFDEAVGRDAGVYRAAGAPLADDDAATLRLFLRNPAIDAAISEAHQDEPLVQRAFIAATLAASGLNLRFFGRGVGGNTHWVRLAVARNGLALAFAEPNVADDVETADIAVRHNGLALYYAGEAARDHAAVVASAVAQNVMALSFASPRLRRTYAGTPAHEAYLAGLRWFAARGHDETENKLARRWAQGHVVGAAWRRLWASEVEIDEARPAALHAGQLTRNDLFVFFGGRDLAARPSSILSRQSGRSGSQLPPPLVDLRTALDAVAARRQKVGPRPLLPRELSTRRFAGYLARRFEPDGTPRL